jgi:hypothetical protein
VLVDIVFANNEDEYSWSRYWEKELLVDHLIQLELIQDCLSQELTTLKVSPCTFDNLDLLEDKELEFDEVCNQIHETIQQIKSI